MKECGTGAVGIYPDGVLGWRGRLRGFGRIWNWILRLLGAWVLERGDMGFWEEDFEKEWGEFGRVVFGPPWEGRRRVLEALGRRRYGIGEKKIWGMDEMRMRS